jgi:hypothetical protein
VEVPEDNPSPAALAQVVGMAVRRRRATPQIQAAAAAAAVPVGMAHLALPNRWLGLAALVWMTISLGP